MISRYFPALILVPCLVGTVGCRDAPESPSQQSVDEAWKRADQAAQQSVAAQSDVKHVARLRDIDRLRYQTDVAELSAQVSTMRGLAVTLSLALLAALMWLAVEIRRRRVLSAVMRFARPDDGDQRSFESPPDDTAALIH